MAGSVVIRELLTVYGFDVDSTDLDLAEQRLGKVMKIAGAVGAAFTAATAALVANASAVADDALSIQRQADSLNISTDAVQEYRHAFAQFHADSKDIDDAFNTLADRATDAAGGMKSFIDDFGVIGMRVDEMRGKKPDELFALFAEKIAATTDVTKRNTAAVRILGDDLGAKLLPMLIEGADGLERMREEAHRYGVVMSVDQIQAAKKFGTQQQLMLAVLVSLRNQLGLEVIPLLTAAAQVTLDWWMANREWVNAGIHKAFQRIGDAAGVVISVLRFLFDVTNHVAQAFGGWNRVLTATSIILATLGLATLIFGFQQLITWVNGMVVAYLELGAAAQLAHLRMLLIPLAIAALLVLIGLVIEDFDKFFNGQKSAIGEVLKEYPALSEAILGLKDDWNEVKGAFDNFIDQTPGAFSNFKDWLFGQGFELVDWWNDTMAMLDKAWDAFVDYITGNGLLDKISKVIDMVPDVAVGVATNGAVVPGVAAAIEQAQTSPALRSGASSSVSTVTDSSSTTYQIQSSDPKGVRREIEQYERDKTARRVSKAQPSRRR